MLRNSVGIVKKKTHHHNIIDISKRKGTLERKLSTKSIRQKDKHSTEGPNVQCVLYNSFIIKQEMTFDLTEKFDNSDFKGGDED